MLTLHQLEVFATVAEQRSVRCAAEQLVVTQPAVSASLAALEKAIGVELVQRAGRGIELTDAGRTLERYARLVLGMVTEAVAATQFSHDAVDAPVRIGASSAAADGMLMGQLAALRHQRPSVQFTLEVGNRARVWQLLVDRSVDIAVTTRPPATGPFVSVATRPNELVLVAKPGLVWPGKVGDTTWLLREDGSSSRAATDEVMTLLGVMPPMLPIGSNAAILASAEAGLGIALLSAETVADAIQARRLTLVRTDATPLVKPWHLVVRGGEPLASAIRQLVLDLVEHGTGFEWTVAGAALVRGQVG